MYSEYQNQVKLCVPRHWRYFVCECLRGVVSHNLGRSGPGGSTHRAEALPPVPRDMPLRTGRMIDWVTWITSKWYWIEIYSEYQNPVICGVRSWAFSNANEDVRMGGKNSAVGVDPLDPLFPMCLHIGFWESPGQIPCRILAAFHRNSFYKNIWPFGSQHSEWVNTEQLVVFEPMRKHWCMTVFSLMRVYKDWYYMMSEVAGPAVPPLPLSYCRPSENLHLHWRMPGYTAYDRILIIWVDFKSISL